MSRQDSFIHVFSSIIGREREWQRYESISVTGLGTMKAGKEAATTHSNEMLIGTSHTHAQYSALYTLVKVL